MATMNSISLHRRRSSPSSSSSSPIFHPSKPPPVRPSSYLSSFLLFVVFVGVPFLLHACLSSLAGVGVGATSIYVVEVEKPTSGAEYAAFNCKGKTGGPFPDPDDCAVYHHCMFGRDFTQNCAAG